ncbi:uncharacterized protein LOC117335414 [Pecten maximus]|uniref:uncharacterized protein LOC117335414 n=1 Tax=Pecten maximus TaxID=6579 RepID=UPI0014588FF6|nr:uncharacterized protein LOC117335414 [Pecten maximus]
MDKLVSFLVTLTILGASHAATKTDDPNCIIDSTLEATASGNYLDCLSDEMVAAGTTSCCTIDKAKGCCKEGGRWDKMIIIGCAIGGTTIVLAIIIFYVMWCKRDTIPCIGRCMDCTQRKYYEVEESFCCCEGRVMKRRQEQEIMKKCKEQPAFSLPEEAVENTKKEDFWQGQLIKS